MYNKSSFLYNIHMDIETKKELAVGTYELTFDKGLAYTKAELTEEEKGELDHDEEFQSRLNYFLVLKREELAQKFWGLLKSQDEKIVLKTILELGPLVYPDFFNRNKGDKKPLTADEVTEFFNELSNQ